MEHGGISLFELSKFAPGAVNTEEQRWLKFFKDGERLDAERLPDWMLTNERRQAMSTLKRFSDKERAYDAYQARQDYLRMQGSRAPGLHQPVSKGVEGGPRPRASGAGGCYGTNGCRLAPNGG